MTYDYYGREVRVPKTVGMATIVWDGGLPPAATTPAVVVVGQNPGRNEDAKGVPFIGDSGQLVRNAFLPGAHIGKYATVYITNAVRCFTVGNVVPPAGPIKACSGYLLSELEGVSAYHRETYVLCLGAVASIAFLKHCVGHKKSKQSDAFRLNGHYFPLPSGRRVRHYSTKHPAAYLRDKNLGLIIRDHIEMLSQALQGVSPTVSRPNFAPLRMPNA